MTKPCSGLDIGASLCFGHRFPSHHSRPEQLHVKSDDLSRTPCRGYTAPWKQHAVQAPDVKNHQDPTQCRPVQGSRGGGARPSLCAGGRPRLTPWDCIAQRVHPPQCECVPGSVVYGKQVCLSEAQSGLLCPGLRKCTAQGWALVRSRNLLVEQGYLHV